MAKPEWGTKRSCPKCEARFYDLNKSPAECPACQHSFDPEAPVKKRVKRKPGGRMVEDAAEKALASTLAAKKKGEITGDDDQEIDLPEFEDLGIIEDMDELDDMAEVEVIKPKGAEKEEEEFLDEDEILQDEDVIDDEEDGEENR